MKSKIQSFEQACTALKLAPVIPDVSNLPEEHQKSIIAFYKLTIIIQAMNGKWKPNWSNYNESKYYNWFEVDASKKQPSGFGFSDSGYAHTYTHTYVGSRLCFKTRELANYAREQFKDLYQDYLLIP